LNCSEIAQDRLIKVAGFGGLLLFPRFSLAQQPEISTMPTIADKNSLLKKASDKAIIDELWARVPQAATKSLKDLPHISSAKLAAIMKEREKPKRRFLESVDTESLIEAIRFRDKSVYQTDDRQDMYEVKDADVLRNADGVVALIETSKLREEGKQKIRIITEKFGIAQRLCPTEIFFDQPTAAWCTGFLIDEDIIVTAGHCVSQNTINKFKYVFGFRMLAKDNAVTLVNKEEVYSAKEIIGRTFTPDGADWALVRLGKKVDIKSHPPLQFRQGAQKISNDQAVYVLGYPSGLPLKYAGNAKVIENSHTDYFAANLDTFGGNSGSPVFNSDHKVEGILVRGDADFVPKDDCFVRRICPQNSDCVGEACTRINQVKTV